MASPIEVINIIADGTWTEFSVPGHWNDLLIQGRSGDVLVSMDSGTNYWTVKSGAGVGIEGFNVPGQAAGISSLWLKADSSEVIEMIGKQGL